MTNLQVTLSMIAAALLAQTADLSGKAVETGGIIGGMVVVCQLAFSTIKWAIERGQTQRASSTTPLAALCMKHGERLSVLETRTQAIAEGQREIVRSINDLRDAIDGRAEDHQP